MRPCPQCGTACGPEHAYCAGCGFPVGSLGTNTEDRLVGQALPGGYLILDLISVGGMGRVYRAEQRALGRTVAIKVIHPHLLADENSIARFMTEARAASQLNHPNSVSVIDFGRTEDGQPYLVMEFLRGKDLSRVAYEEGPLPFRRIVDVLIQALAALSEAHELGIIHRDMKPENIILEPLRRGGDFVKVVDFGLAKLKADSMQATSVTLPGIVCGTPDYMAPEQGRGDPIDGRSDLYAVGVILFQLLTGRLPFDADNPTQVVMMHLSIPTPDPRQVAPERGIPDALVRIVMKAMAKNPVERYQDAEEFAEALKQSYTEIRTAGSHRPTTPSFLPGRFVDCPHCQNHVPAARFCCECAGALPTLSAAEPLEAVTPTLPLPLFGRDEDLTWLEGCRAEAANRLHGARLVGEHGSGKTRLIEEFAARAQDQGDTVVLTGPDPYGAEVAYHALRRAIAGLAQLDASSTAVHRWTGANASARCGLEEIFRGRPDANDARSPVEHRYDLAEALRWALQRAVEMSPNQRVLLSIDDLHRIDGSSRFAVTDVLQDPPADVGALILASHPPGFDAGWGPEAPARVVPGLPPPAVSRALATFVPAGRIALPPDAGVRGLAPLYVEHAIRYAEEGGTDPPSRLADLIIQRVATLKTRDRRVLQALGVLGDRVEPSAIAELLGDDEPFDETFDALADAGMVKRTDGTVSVSHPLVREVVLGAIPAEVRRDLHARAARLYEEREAPLEARAIHAYYAQDVLEALLLLEQVADRALARDDVRAAVEALRRGLELARADVSRGELDDPLRAVAIFGRKLGDALTRAGSFSDAEGVLREALDLTSVSGSDRAHVLASLARVAHGRSRPDEAFDYLDAAIEMAQKSGSQDLLNSLRHTRRAWAS
jgi:hypothetical protein